MCALPTESVRSPAAQVVLRDNLVYTADEPTAPIHTGVGNTL